MLITRGTDEKMQN